MNMVVAAVKFIPLTKKSGFLNDRLIMTMVYEIKNKLNLSEV